MASAPKLPWGKGGPRRRHQKGTFEKQAPTRQEGKRREKKDNSHGKAQRKSLNSGARHGFHRQKGSANLSVRPRLKILHDAPLSLERGKMTDIIGSKIKHQLRGRRSSSERRFGNCKKPSRQGRGGGSVNFRKKGAVGLMAESIPKKERPAAEIVAPLEGKR